MDTKKTPKQPSKPTPSRKDTSPRLGGNLRGPATTSPSSTALTLQDAMQHSLSVRRAKSEKITEPKPKLRMLEGLEARVARLNSPRVTSAEAHAQADRLYEMSAFRNMTPEEEAKARGMGPEMVESIRETRERRERGIKARRERLAQ